MVGQNILDEIEKKSQAILHSNDELAAKLKRNQDMIARFSEELEELKAESKGKDMDSSAKQKLEMIKSDLEEKKKLIADMMADMKPLEIDIARRDNVIDALKQRVDDQSGKIESLSKDILDSKKQMQQLFDSNKELRSQLAEKEGILKVIKDKLTEKTSLLKETEEKRKFLEQETENNKKQIFALNNKIGALEKRVFSTNEQNQRLLYEITNQKAKFKSAEEALAEKNRIISSQKAEAAANLEAIRAEEEEKRVMIMKNHSRKITAMNAAIDSLRTKLGQQNRLIGEKTTKERALIDEFNRRMQELMATKAEPVDISSADVDFRADDETPAIQKEDEKDSPMFSIESPEDTGEEESHEDIGPSKVEEIMPIIELAMDHGDNTEQIKHSLISSGYSEKDIEDALSRLNLAEQ